MSKLSEALDILNNLPKTEKAALAQASDLSALLCALREVTDYAAAQACPHEETYRGGVLWEICSQCGYKWSDDEGGRPEGAGAPPESVTKAYDLLSKHGA